MDVGCGLCSLLKKATIVVENLMPSQVTSLSTIYWYLWRLPGSPLCPTAHRNLCPSGD